MKHLETYSTFILEHQKGSRTEKISMDEAVRIFNDKCSDWDLDKNTQIWRGSHTAHDIYYINPEKHGFRDSASTSGFYQALLPSLESWKKAPRRDQSLIMVTKYLTAATFGDDSAHLMIPFNNVEIGVSICDDLWCSNYFMKKITGDDSITWGDIDSEFHDFLKSNAQKFMKPIEKSWIKPLRENIIEILKSVDSIPKNELNLNWTFDGGEKYKYETIALWLKDYPNMPFLEFVSMLFDFEKNGFKVINKQSQLEDDKEVWSSGEFIGIHNDKVEEFRQKVKLSRNSNQSNNQN